ncbi:hypothetical protein MP638_000566, partial [Amoeboaphelidium occidentale]
MTVSAEADVNVQKLLKEVCRIEMQEEEQEENLNNDQDFQRSCNAIRSDLRKFLDIDKTTTRTALLKFLSVNSNSYGRFMSYRGAWQGAPFFRRWKMVKKNLKSSLGGPAESGNGSSSTAQPKKNDPVAKAAYAKLLDEIAAQEPSWSEDQLDDERKMMVYLNCDEVRKLIFDFLHKHQGVTNRTAFAKELGFTPRALMNFLETKGEYKGAKSEVYFCAYDFFDRLRKLEGRPVPPGREAMEKCPDKEGKYSILARKASTNGWNDAGNVYAIALYGESLLLTSTNDVVQKSIETGKVERTFRAHSKSINSFVLTNDSRMITSSLDANIIVWNLDTGSILRRIWLGSENAMIMSISFQDGMVFAGCIDGKVRHVNLVTGRIVRAIDIVYSVTCVVAHNSFMYVGRKTLPDISKIHIPSGDLTLTFNGHRYTVFGLAVSENRLFSASEDATIRQWNSVTGSVILTYYGHSDSVYVVSLYNNELYTGGRDELVIKWSIDDGRILRTFPREHVNSIYCYTFKDHLLYSGALDGVIVQRDLNTGLPGNVYASRNMKLWSVVAWGNFIICSGEDAAISLWDSTVNSVMESAILFGHSSPVNCLVVYESTLFSGDSDAFIRHWNLTDLSNLRVLIGHEDTVADMKADQSFLFSGGRDRYIIQWSIQSFEVLAQLRGHMSYVSSLQIQGTSLFSGSSDFFAIRWNLPEKEKETVYAVTSEVSALCIVGDLLIIGSNGLDAFSISTGVLTLTIPEMTICFSIVSSGQIIFTAHDDSLIRSRDINTLDIFGVYQGHRDFVSSLYLDKFGVLFSASFDGTIKKWNMASRRIAFSFENRNNSVTSLAVIGQKLFVGTKSGIINSFIIDDGYHLETFKRHNEEVTSIISNNNYLYSSGADGKLLRFDPYHAFDGNSTFYDAGSVALKGLASYKNGLVAVKGDSEILLISFNTSIDFIRTISASKPVMCVAANDDLFFSGSKTGEILAWNHNDLQLSFELKGHTSQVNSIILDHTALYSSSDDKTIIQWSWPVMCVAANDNLFFSGSKTGEILAWNHNDLQLSFELKGHTSQVNSLVLNEEYLYSSSDDKTIIQWSWLERVAVKDFKRSSANSLGHLGSVNAISICNSVLFSAGSDLTVRKWSVRTGTHDDVYFGFSLPVTSVLCFNGSVFAGSEDFSVLLFKPGSLGFVGSTQTENATKSTSKVLKTTQVIRKFRYSEGGIMSVQVPLLVVAISISFLLFVSATFCYFSKQKRHLAGEALQSKTAIESSTTVSDLQTIINSVMGISKHAAYIIDHPAIAKVRKLTSGGGGELFIAQVMEPSLSRRVGQLVIQKV